MQGRDTHVWLKDTDLTSVDAVKAYLAEQAAAGTPVTLVYPLKTPYTVQLTPQQLTLLKGSNAIWSDTGDTAVAYIADTKMYIDAHGEAVTRELYASVYPDVVATEYTLGGLSSADGGVTSSTTRVRSGWISPKHLRVSADPSVQYIYYYYAGNSTSAYLGRSGTEWLSDTTNAIDYANAAGAKFVRLLLRKADDSTITSASDVSNLVEIRSPMRTEEDVYGTYTPDVPESTGVLNTVLNFKQMVELKYTPLQALPLDRGEDFPAGVERTGLVYSSSRPEAGFVPNFVSLHTFMTALQNPNSYLYTVDLAELGNVNGATYYGAVCSTSCGYALGLVPNYSTHQWGDIPGMHALECQSVYALKLGDTICGNGHVVMVTDITRNGRGKIGSITISEAGGRFVLSQTYTPQQVASLYPTGTYTYYRYSQIHAVEHVQSPYVAVEDETPQEVVYNTAIIPRKGDKANWLAGVPVEIDVLDAGSYTSVEVYKDETMYSTLDIAALITLTDLPYGSYKARLTDGTNASDWCYWMVVDAASTVIATGTAGEIRVDFSVSNAEPLFVAWNRSDNNGTVHISSLTAEDLEAGSTICSYETGSYKVRVAFRTEYGIIHSVLSDIITV